MMFLFWSGLFLFRGDFVLFKDVVGCDSGKNLGKPETFKY